MLVRFTGSTSKMSTHQTEESFCELLIPMTCSAWPKTLRTTNFQARPEAFGTEAQAFSKAPVPLSRSVAKALDFETGVARQSTKLHGRQSHAPYILEQQLLVQDS